MTSSRVGQAGTIGEVDALSAETMLLGALFPFPAEERSNRMKRGRLLFKGTNDGGCWASE